MAVFNYLMCVLLAFSWISFNGYFVICNEDDLIKANLSKKLGSDDDDGHLQQQEESIQSSDPVNGYTDMSGSVFSPLVTNGPQHRTQDDDLTDMVSTGHSTDDVHKHVDAGSIEADAIHAGHGNLTDDIAGITSTDDEIARISKESDSDDSLKQNAGGEKNKENIEATVDETKYNSTADQRSNKANSNETNFGKETQKPTSKQKSDSNRSCPHCDRENARKTRIEMFKQHMLDKLGLTTIPNVTEPLHPLPFDFYIGEDFSINDEDDVDYDRNTVKTREVFIYGEDITDKCLQKGGTGCYSFNLTNRNFKASEIDKIEMWVYKQATPSNHVQTFMVSELKHSRHRGKSILRSRTTVKRLETGLKHGWMKFYIKRAVLRWLSKPQCNKGLAIVCKTCKRMHHRAIYGGKHGRLPFLVFYMKQTGPPKQRHRRAVQCTEGGANCCHKEPLEIRFRDIGWNYIMAPDSIRTNFCTGSCNGLQAAHYNHTRLMQTLRNTVIPGANMAVQPCCSPVSFRRPQSLIYRDHIGDVRKIDLPDLIVGECGCT